MRRIIPMILGLILIAPVSWAGDKATSGEQKSKDSYSLGYDFGSNLKRQGVDIDEDLLLSALKDGLHGRKPLISPDEIRETLIELRKRLLALQNQRIREFAAKNLEEGKAFLEANKTREGIKTLPSGLQFKVLKEGNGPIPKATDAVKVHYRGSLTDGREFDSSYGRGEPATMNLTGVIKGWREALQLMQAGSRWQIFVPPDLGYGKRPFGRIPPNSTLIFELELLSLAENPGSATPTQVNDLPPQEEEVPDPEPDPG